MCWWMFAVALGVSSLAPVRSISPSLPIEPVQVVKQEIRRSPRKRPRKMPSLLMEHLRFTIVAGELHLRVMKGPSRLPRDDKQYKYLTVENWFNYPDLKDYYGPLNIVQIIQFVDLVKMQIAQNPERTVCLVTKSESQQSLNALLLAAAYLVLVQDLHPKEATMRIHPVLREIQGATHYKTEGEPQDNDLPITILDCLQGLQTFTTAGLLNLNTIDVKETIKREHPLHGDMNWVVPGKILALAGPTADVYPITDFVEYAKTTGITAVVRLNRTHYPAAALKHARIYHHEMFIYDGHYPTMSQIEQFCEIAEYAWENGAMAVHCRAGLGRTGTMIAIFLIRKFKFEAAEVIAYLRMMRPGSVLGMQARYLDCIQYVLRGEPVPPEAAALLREYYPESADELVPTDEEGILSEDEFFDSDEILTQGAVKAQ